MRMGDQHFFDFAAQVGLTKHLGGLEATKEIIQHCHITQETHILDVGCGVGQTATYISKTVGAKVTGIDINPGMVKRSRERAKKHGVTHLTEFHEADAQKLPFPDNHFDAVITESVTAFPQDKQKTVNEYTRVTKPGGYIGLNESTWLKTPPPQEILDWVSQEVGATVTPLTGEEWTHLLEKAALNITMARTSEIKVSEETRGLVNRYGYGGVIATILRGAKMYLTNPSYRQFLRRVQKRGITPQNLTEYFGYGVYIAQKPTPI
jgi:ubiquinone/menaquinone biosynthesis C-methylase UbiE